jgi:hypothetical protein
MLVLAMTVSETVRPCSPMVMPAERKPSKARPSMVTWLA